MKETVVSRRSTVDILHKWLPVDQYTGGAEHSVLHLMYSRFITMALQDMGYLTFEEPFPHFYAHGLLIKDGVKMSKSRGNVVNPDDYIDAYGADSLRLYLMFIGPFSAGGDFRDTGMKGMHRFVKKVHALAVKAAGNLIGQEDPTVWRELAKTTQKMAKDFGRFKYNTAIAKLMQFVSLWSDSIDKTGPKVAGRVAILLAPLAPHLAEEIWKMARSQRTTDYRLPTTAKMKEAVDSRQLAVDQRWSVHQQTWPEVDQEMIQEETVMVIVQVNGKKRGEVRIKNQESRVKEKVVAAAKKLERVKEYLGSKQVKKIIFVPGKLVNFVID